MSLEERLGRALEAKKAVELTIKKIEKEIQESLMLELKHGDVTTNFNDYYFLWLKQVEGQLRMANKLHIMPATWSKKYEEGDRECIVGNIFDGYNPWSKNE